MLGPIKRFLGVDDDERGTIISVLFIITVALIMTLACMALT
jgi:hypothetical protein